MTDFQNVRLSSHPRGYLVITLASNKALVLELLCQACKVVSTLWKFHDFSVTKILREINFRESRGHFRGSKYCKFVNS